MPEQDDRLTRLTVTEAATAIRNGSITSEKLAAACLSRISERDSGIKAFTHLNPGLVMEEAKAADRTRANGHAMGPLHGVPIAIKDVIDTAGYLNENGCPVYSGHQPDRDAPCVAALRSAGAIILGKTVTTELALLTPSPTRNPVDTRRSPGGSSAGSAAAVADFMAPAALGTQTAGSVIRPASYCGVYGYKPTFGLIPRSGVLVQSPTLDTVGLFARSIDDIALLTGCMSVHDGTDPTSYHCSGSGIVRIAGEEPPETPRFAFVKTPAWAQADPAMQTAFIHLGESLGEHCDELEIPELTEVLEWQRLVQLAENAGYYGPLQDRARELLSPGLNARLDEGAKVPVRAYVEALAGREPAYERIAKLMGGYSAILTPAAPGPAPRLEEGITGSPIFNGLWTYLGMPAISLPVLELDGLPVGVQLVGLRRDDGRLLRTARWLAARFAR